MWMEVDMARLTRWGNSNGGLRIPKCILETADLQVGDEIGCRLRDDGTILLIPRKGKKPILEDQSKAHIFKQPDPEW